MGFHPQRVRDNKNPIGLRSRQPQTSRLDRGVPKIGTVQTVGIVEGRSRFLESHAVLRKIGGRFRGIPLELHVMYIRNISQYGKPGVDSLGLSASANRCTERMGAHSSVGIGPRRQSLESKGFLRS